MSEQSNGTGGYGVVSDPHAQTSGLGWPLVTLGGLVILAVTAVTITGHDASALTNTISVLLSSVGAAGGVGAWVNSSRAAKQTNGVLDARMDAAVQRGIAAALATSAAPTYSGRASLPEETPGE